MSHRSNVKHKGIKLLEENIGKILHDMGLEMTSRAQQKINKLDFIKIKNFCSAKNTDKRIKRQAITGRKYLQPTYLTKDLYIDYIKNS